MERVQDLSARRWYMEQTLANGWSRNILALQIDAQAHARHGKAVSNFATLLPAPQSDLAQQAFKDPDIFDFLTLTEPFHERELETQLVRDVQKFLLELGQGFAFVGRQYRLDVGDEDFYLDLLFYHLRLRAFVVIDLKKGKFKPEYGWLGDGGGWGRVSLSRSDGRDSASWHHAEATARIGPGRYLTHAESRRGVESPLQDGGRVSGL